MLWNLSPAFLVSWDLIRTPPKKISTFLSSISVTIQMITTMLLIPIWQILSTAKLVRLSGLTVGMVVTPILFIVITLLTKNKNQKDVDALWEAYHAGGIVRGNMKATRE